MKYAVIISGGSQYLVHEGDTIRVDRREEEEGGTVKFDDVLLYGNGEAVNVGAPKVAGISVKGTVTAHTKGEKIRVSTYHAKSRHRKTKGHRQQLTTIKIEEIATAKVASPATHQPANPPMRREQ